MNRRSFLGLLPLAPIVGPALAKEAAAGIADAMKRERISGIVGRMHAVKPDIATLGMEIDSSSVDRAVARLRQAASCAAIGERGPEAFINLPKDRVSGVRVIEENIPDDIWPI